MTTNNMTTIIKPTNGLKLFAASVAIYGLLWMGVGYVVLNGITPADDFWLASFLLLILITTGFFDSRRAIAYAFAAASIGISMSYLLWSA